MSNIIFQNKVSAEKNKKSFARKDLIKNLLLGDVLDFEIDNKISEFGIDTSFCYACIVFKIFEEADANRICKLLGSLFYKESDLVLSLSSRKIILVKSVLKENTCVENLVSLAKTAVDTLQTQMSLSCKSGVGTIVESIKNIAESFKEANLSLKVGEIFLTEKVASYDRLGIPRLIYQLPTALCKTFLDETFGLKFVNFIGDEIEFVICKFFENNLNITETAKKLFMHRNTLVYRLEKLKENTGLDARKFEDAVILRVALLVKKYFSQVE